MSDYTQSTDFSAKDALTTGDPNKKIQGADLDIELAAISSAIASKADTATDTHTGTHTFANITATGTVNLSSSTLTLPDGTTHPITLGTEQASTSGTSIDFTSIPSGTKKITIQFVGVSTSGTNEPFIQIGDSGGVETSGYLSTSSNLTTVIGTTRFTTAFGLRSVDAASFFHGGLVLTLEDSANNTWVISGVVSDSNVLAPATITVGGSKSLSAELDRVRITTNGGTDTFDAGAINIQYET